MLAGESGEEAGGDGSGDDGGNGGGGGGDLRRRRWRLWGRCVLVVATTVAVEMVATATSALSLIHI